MPIIDTVLLLAFNLSIASSLCLFLAWIAARQFASLPTKHAILVAGIVASLLSPLAVVVAWQGGLGLFPAISSSLTNTSPSLTLEAAPPLRNITTPNPSPFLHPSPFLPPPLESQLSPTPTTTDSFLIDPSTAPHASLANSSQPIPPSATRPPQNPTLLPHRFAFLSSPRLLYLAYGLLVAWILGTTLQLVRHLQQWWSAKTFLSHCPTHHDPLCLQTLAHAATTLRLDPVPPLFESPTLPAPIVLGLLHPRVVLPRDASRILTPSQLLAVLTHELAHIARKDTWVVALQACLTILFWWNPLTWWTCRQVAALRELVCDDIALRLNSLAKDYARSILTMAERAIERPHAIPSLGISTSPVSELELRIRRILDDPTPRRDTRLHPITLSGILLFTSLLTLGGTFAQVPSRNPSPPNNLSLDQLTSSKPFPDDPVTTPGLANAPLHQLSGQVRLTDNRPASAAKIHLKGHPLSAVDSHLVADQDGKFQFAFRMDPQALTSLQITAESADGSELGLFLPTKATMLSQLSNMQIQLSPPRTVAVEVFDASQQPVPNANVALQLDSPHILQGLSTDSSGRVTARIPSHSKVLASVAWRHGLGLDYRTYRLNRQQKGDLNATPPAFPTDHPERLVLAGARSATIKVTNDDHQPLPGVEVSPFLLTNPQATDNLNLTLFHQTFDQTTDANGETTFDWIPTWHNDLLVFFPNHPNFESTRALLKPSPDNAQLTINLRHLVPIRGRVLDPSGKPAPYAEITASGTNHTTDAFQHATWTNPSGEYELNVPFHHAYLLTAKAPGLAAPPQSGFVVMPTQTEVRKDFQLQPATRVFGQLLHETSKEPLANQRVQVVQYGLGLHEIPNVDVPNPSRSPLQMKPMLSYLATTNEDGEFNLELGDGNYAIAHSAQPPGNPFSLSDHSDFEIQVLTKILPDFELSGQVVDEHQQPLTGIRITAIPAVRLGQEWQATSDEQGHFRVRSKGQPTYLFASTPDQFRAGMIAVQASQKTCTLVLQPTGKISGRLLNPDRSPASQQTILYGIAIRGEHGETRYHFGGQLQTDNDGAFVAKGLAPNCNYTFSLPLSANRLQTIATMQVNPEESLNLGDFTLPSR